MKRAATCKRCGKPSAKPYCRACVDARLGVVVKHTCILPERFLDPNWKLLSDGGFQRAKHGI